MIAAIRKYLFAGAGKSPSTPHIFVVLCVYAFIVTVYTGLFYGGGAMLVRLGLSLFIVLSYVIIERSPLSAAATAFLAPTLMVAALIAGSVYFGGDFLLFTYSFAVGTISLAYLKPKSLAAFIAVSGAVSAAALFIFKINLLGQVFSALHNVLNFVVSVALNILVWVFCKSYVKTLETMAEAQNEANRSAKAKGSFLANMSHEFRTPLNAIIGLTDAELRRELPEADLENLRKIRSSGRLLMGIINDILDMSKIESGKFGISAAPYDLAEVIYDVSILNAVRIGERPIKFIILANEDIPRRLLGDALRVKQLLNNLLSNAFKYTAEGSVELRAACRAERGGITLAFTVKDTGMGIREDALEKLFSEYAQVNQQSTRGIEGTGLGLAISKGLAELMGGGISAQSRYGQGSVFSAEIWQEVIDETPLGAETAAALKNLSYRPDNAEQQLTFTPWPEAAVLVVDDVKINLEVAAACLEPYGMRVDCTDSGADALRCIESGAPRYDLILMDHMMPGIDGIETTRAIRRLGTAYAKSIPVIALTANALAGNEQLYAENGFQGFLPKPIDPQKLDALLRRWLP